MDVSWAARQWSEGWLDRRIRERRDVGLTGGQVDEKLCGQIADGQIAGGKDGWTDEQWRDGCMGR